MFPGLFWENTGKRSIACNGREKFTMKKVALIIPYYGKFHNYFPIWVQTASYNLPFDFFLITDIETDLALPANLHVVKKSFAELREEIKALFDFEIILDTPYKLCEYRPVYGRVFSGMLQDYAFWGYCDVDLLFGDISSFITDEIFNNNDAILSHGHFTLFRNTEQMNNLYLSVKGRGDLSYKQAYATKFSCHFDEWSGISQYIEDIGIPRFDKMVFADILYKWFDFRPAQYRDDGNQRIYRWGEGVLTEYTLLKDGSVTETERMYLHLQKRPMKWDGQIRNSYLIVPNEILDGDCMVDAELIRRWSKKKLVYWHYLRLRKRHIFNKIAVIIEERCSTRIKKRKDMQG